MKKITFKLNTAMDHENLTQYAQPQYNLPGGGWIDCRQAALKGGAERERVSPNNFSKTSLTVQMRHGFIKIIFRLRSYLHFLIDSLAHARLTLRVASGNLTQPVIQASIPITVFRFKSLLLFLNILVLLMFTMAASAATTLNGSGATFPAPLYQRWAVEFHKNNPSIAINYQGVGSGSGIADFTRGLTDFSASDVAMKDREIDAIHGNVVMIPATAGMIVLSYNIPGVTQLKLSRAAYVGIFLGTVTQWNDPLIAASNPEIKLPDLPITVMTRSDGSGTTALVTEHLSAISPDFFNIVGTGRSVKWPTGLAGKGNGGVTSLIKRTTGSIGYIEFGFATGNHLPMASLENKNGDFIAPSFEAGCKTIATIELPENLRGFIYDPVAPGSYPIISLSWILLKKEYPNEKDAAIRAFMNYALTEGQSLSPSLGYLTLPPIILEKSKKAIAQLACIKQENLVKSHEM